MSGAAEVIQLVLLGVWFLTAAILLSLIVLFLLDERWRGPSKK